ncbi:MAG: RNA polymerase sigma factor [Limisphaerales bacterium]
MTPGATDDQDRADMIRLSAGHDDALNDLMDRHGKKLFHYLARALQSEDDAADLAQETFCRVYQSRAKYNPRQKFSTWLYAIATNLVKDRYRYRTRHPQVSLDAENAEMETSLQDRLPDHHATPSETLASTERAETVRRAVAALPEELRLPLILAEYEERSHAEIGEVLGCTAKAVETRIYRARLQLRQTLAALMRTT